MKPMPGLDALLTRAAKLGIFGTKMRSVIDLPSRTGIAAMVAQQFEVAAQIAEHGPDADHRAGSLDQEPGQGRGEAILLEELMKALDALPEGRRVMLKLTIPDVADFYSTAGGPSARGQRRRAVRRLHASGCLQALAGNHGMIASFSRALAEDLRHSMSDAEFNAALGKSIDEIYRASTVKV